MPIDDAETDPDVMQNMRRALAVGAMTVATTDAGHRALAAWLTADRGQALQDFDAVVAVLQQLVARGLEWEEVDYVLLPREMFIELPGVRPSLLRLVQLARDLSISPEAARWTLAAETLSQQQLHEFM